MRPTEAVNLQRIKRRQVIYIYFFKSDLNQNGCPLIRGMPDFGDRTELK